MENPLSNSYGDKSDNELVKAAVTGSQAALEALVKRHQHYIYNVAHKMVLSPFDAEDITQEVLIIVITKLSQFRAESNFRTWLYRIVFNYVLQTKRRWLEDYITDFSGYGKQLDSITNQSLSDYEQIEMKELIEEAKLGCMAGMLLCLSREQRLVYILGEIFQVDHNLGSQLLTISKDNFRQQLSRARSDLYQFMNDKCGLVNKNNPCRCHKKTKGFIAAGWVDPTVIKFNGSYLKRIYELAGNKAKELDDTVEVKYADLFRQHPFQEKEHVEKIASQILQDKDVTDIFDLN